MPPDAAPAGVEGASCAVAGLEAFCREQALDRRHFAVDFIRAQAPQARLVLGAETAAQVEENCALFTAPPLDPAIHAGWLARWPDDLEPLIDPRLWKS
jgi:aryl-alcohol dehydrogenase-like predicted oxidoreductase